MSSFVVATAGHVDHGKSALVRALTGIEPDRFVEERRRGLTIDLGFAWTTLPGGAEVSFVDVPGHERFLGNMLAGIGPVPVVCFVIAADSGWQAQSSDHRDAIAALGIDRGLLVVTRSDLAPDASPRVIAEARRELAETRLADMPAVVVSARTGEGLEDLRRGLAEVLDTAPAPSAEGPVRMWIDRSFSISGAGTVVTGTLGAGTIGREDRLELLGPDGSRAVTVRGLQGRGDALESIGPVSRAALNLRGVPADQVSRGDVLVSPGEWHLTAEIDVRHESGIALDATPREVMVHAGTVAIAGRLRSFGEDHARLTLPRELPLRIGDRLILRAGGAAVLAGVAVLDADPPSLSRRGDGRRRNAALAGMPAGGDLVSEVRRRSLVPESTIRRLGLHVPDDLPGEVRRHRGRLVDARALDRWAAALGTIVAEEETRDPLSPGVSRRAATDRLGLPDSDLLDLVIDGTGGRIIAQDGRLLGVSHGTATQDLGIADAAVRALEARLGTSPFHAPEAEELRSAGLGTRELAAAAHRGRLLRLEGEVILLPSSPALAMRRLAVLPQPFTASQAREALETTRRVAIPLLELLDSRGWTRRVDGSLREVVR